MRHLRLEEPFDRALDVHLRRCLRHLEDEDLPVFTENG